MASKPTTSSIFFATVPDYKDLCSVTIQVQDSASSFAKRGGTASKYVGSQPQIVKCRELIFTEPGLLASPSLQQEGHIYVVLQQSVWRSGRLQSRCQKMGLVVSKPMQVISPIFQACLAYTIRARLAPLWNKAGNWYIQGRDFLLSSGRVPAVDLQVNVTEVEICLALRPLTVKLPQCSLIDFDVCQPVLDQFFLSTNNVIFEYSIDSKWCFVLPSLKKGKVVSISHNIPSTSPFKTYKEIRRYWKNAYGYRLPESDVGVLYYNIYFPAIGPTLFTYPEFCIRKDEPILQARVDPAPIISAFLTDLRHKLPSVCGSSFQITPKALYTSTGFYPTGKEEDKLPHLNLSSTPPPTSICRIPTRPISLQGFAGDHVLSVPSLTQPASVFGSPTANLLTGTVGEINAAFSIAGRVSFPGAHPVSPTDQHVDSQFATHGHRTLNGPANTTLGAQIAVSPPVRHTAFRPVLPKPIVGDQAGFGLVNTWNGKAYANSAFSEMTSCGFQSTSQCLPVVTALSANQSGNHTVAPAPQRIIPSFKTQRPQTSNYFPASTACVRGEDPSPRIVPSFQSTKKVHLHPKSQLGTSALDTTNKAFPQPRALDAVGLSSPMQAAFDQPKAADPVFVPSFPHRDSSQATREPTAAKKQVQQTLDAVVIKIPSGANHQKYDSGKSTKRKSKDDTTEGPTATKKARVKPKVQEGVNVQLLAINDQLSKVNTITLATWLQDKGIPVKAKEKKSDLMQKVADFIHANSIED
ncbi:uncharacterized protein LOC110974745 [Acanthaster planci]|uniref:Uncharacterized protein LOC110974745 n=1 Tax=Acanthaster planci TaxID=133434 RepID=A0A8B7XQG7_ACAPL|nr:uncharacterized protein LOC110974745 [Acanthaster planci]